MYSRELRRIGELPESKRGLGAVPVTVEHAAKLLLAGLCSRSQAQVPAVFASFWKMQPDPLYARVSLRVLDEVVQAKSFGQAVQALIEHGTEIQEQVGLNGLQLWLFLNGPSPEAVMRLVSADAPDHQNPIFKMRWSGTAAGKRPPPGSDIGFTYSSAMSEKTFAALARVVSDQVHGAVLESAWAMARQTALPSSLPPIGGTAEVAAAYCSLSVGKFMELVQRGLLPKPKVIDRMKRWDLEAVRIAFKALPDDDETPGDDTWSDVDAA
jgi:hypothetical protein